jgi:hypothetical protein
MAATLITPTQAGPMGAGGTLTAAAPDAANGNVFSNPGGIPTVLVFNNTGGSSITVTFTLPATPYNGLGGFATTKVATVAAGTTQYFCCEPSAYNNSAGQVAFLASTATGCTAAVIQFNRALP